MSEINENIAAALKEIDQLSYGNSSHSYSSMSSYSNTNKEMFKKFVFQDDDNSRSRSLHLQESNNQKVTDKKKINQSINKNVTNKATLPKKSFEKKSLEGKNPKFLNEEFNSSNVAIVDLNEVRENSSESSNSYREDSSIAEQVNLAQNNAVLNQAIKSSYTKDTSSSNFKETVSDSQSDESGVSSLGVQESSCEVIPKTVKFSQLPYRDINSLQEDSDIEDDGVAEDHDESFNIHQDTNKVPTFQQLMLTPTSKSVEDKRLARNQDSNIDITRDQIEILLQNPDIRNVLVSFANSNNGGAIEKTPTAERGVLSSISSLRHTTPKKKNPSMIPNVNEKSSTRASPPTQRTLLTSSSAPKLFDTSGKDSNEKSNTSHGVPAVISTAMQSPTIHKEFRMTSTNSPSKKSTTTSLPSKEDIRIDTTVENCKIKPPKLGTDCAQLPINYIEELQVKTIKDSHFMYIGGSKEKLRMRIKAIDNPDDWDFSNKHNFSGMFYHRNEYIITSPDIKSQSRSLLISEEAAQDKLFVNKIKQMRKVAPHLAQHEVFTKRYFIGFMCLVYDVHMRILGTYDYRKEEFLPGVQVCPPHIERRRRRPHDSQYANLLEIDFSLLPKDVFVIVPVVYDSSPPQAIFPEVHLHCNISVFTKNTISSPNKRQTTFGVLPGNVRPVPGRRDSYWEEPLQKIVMNDLEQPSVSSGIYDVFGLNKKDDENELDNDSLFSIEKEEFLKPSKASNEKVTNTWMHVDSFHATRESPAIGKVIGFEGIATEPQLTNANKMQKEVKNNKKKSNANTPNKDIPEVKPKATTRFAPQSCYIPFVIFRNNQLSQDGSVKWGSRSIEKSFPGTSLREILQTVGDILAKLYILPLHIIHIEHCENCEQHRMTTWHVPGSYEKKYFELKRMFRESLPPCLILSNKVFEHPQTRPRLGSFEISVRPFLSSKTQLVYSKLSSRTIPVVDKIVTDLACHLAPETIVFETSHALEIHLYDSYKKEVLVGATVSIYHMKYNSNISDSTEVEMFGEKIDPSTIKKSIEIFQNKKPFAQNEVEPNSAMNHKHENCGLPHKRPQSAPHTNKKKNIENDLSTKILKSPAIDDAKFRHSAGYLRVRTWSKENVAQWFYSFGLSSDVVNEAARCGVVDGPSFLVLSSVDAFERWGVRNKIKLVKMEKALNDIIQTESEKQLEYDSLVGEDSYDHALSSVPARPNRKQESNYKLVATKKSDHRGLVLASVDCAGAYAIKIETPFARTHTSSVFFINKPGHTAYCASLNPRLGLLKIFISLNGKESQNNPEGFEAGVLVSVVNMQTGRRHIGHAKMISLSTADPKQNNTSSGNGKDTNSDSQPPAPSNTRLLVKRGTVGSLLVSGISARNSRTSILQVSTPKKPVSDIARTMVAHMWLPIGKYYSEIDGVVFVVRENDEDLVENSQKESSLINGDEIATPSCSLNCFENFTWKCHKRLILSSVRGFQKIYRRYKKTFLRDNLWAYLTLKRGLKRLLHRARLRIQARHAIKLQAWQRQRIQRYAYLKAKKNIQIAQEAMRVYNVRLRLKVASQKKRLVKKTIFQYYLKRKGRRFRAALKIQCAYRCHVARIALMRFVLIRRLQRGIKRWIRFNRQKMFERLIVQERMRKEQENLLLMEKEELRMRKFLLDEIAYARWKIEQRIAAAFQFRNKKAIMIQSTYRGYQYRHKRKKGISALIRLQKNFRIKSYEKKVAQGLQVKYIRGFRALEKHRQLLGGIKILLGIYPDDVLTVYSYDHEILHKVLYQPAVRVQSVLKMYRERSRYIRTWQQIHDDYENSPPLYRYLVEVDNASLYDEFTVYSTLSAAIRHDEGIISTDENQEKDRDHVWDNGTDALLQELGFVKAQNAIRFNDKHSEYIPEASSSPIDTPRSLKEERDSTFPTQVHAVQSKQMPPASDPPVTFNSLVSDFKGLFMQPSRRLAMKYAERERKAIIRIQACIRGYLARKNVKQYRAQLEQDLTAEEHTLNQDNDSPKIDNRTDYHQRTSSSNNFFSDITRNKSSSTLVDHQESYTGAEQSMSTKWIPSLSTKLSPAENFHEVKSVLARTFSASANTLLAATVAPQAPLRELGKDLSKGFSSAANKVKAVSKIAQIKIKEAQESKKIQQIKIDEELARMERVYNREFNIEDGVFNIRGTVSENLPRLNRRWYIAVFPHVEDVGLHRGKVQFTDSDLEYEMSQGRCIDEAVRSTNLSPFSRETFCRFNFNIHMADISKYKRLLITVFLEAGDEGTGETVRPDAVPPSISLPSIRTETSKKDSDLNFIAAFHGSCYINGGLSFTPCGGRVEIALKPNPSQAIYLSKAQARRLASIKCINVTGTLMPVAVPRAQLLYSLLCPLVAPPVFPSEILDASIFEKNEIHVKEFYGAAICMVRFAGTNLVSTRHRGQTFGILEFTDDGEYVQQVTEYNELIDTVSVMIPCMGHLACCGSTGNIMMLVAKKNTSRISDNNSIINGTEFENVKIVYGHQAPIIAGTSIHRAGIDFFFTLDKSMNIGITLMEKHLCLRSYINESFLNSPVVGIVASQDRLYLPLENGQLVILSITEIMNGNVNLARNLRQCIVGTKVIFDPSAGITAIAIASSAAFLGMDNNEDIQNSTLINIPAEATSMSDVTNHSTKKKLRSMKIKQNITHHGDISSGSNIDVNDPNRPAPLEGHIIIVAGGDSDPRIKIFRPCITENTDGALDLKEIFALPGHSKAATHIIADAAGRFIITASQGSKNLLVWNALSFNIEMTYDQYVAGAIGIGHNCLFLCSYKAPFITILKPPLREEDIKRKTKYRLKNGDDDSFGEVIIRPDGQPEIAMFRSNVWCTTTVIGGRTVPEKSLSVPAGFLGFGGKPVVERWKKHYDQGVKKVTKLDETKVRFVIGDDQESISEVPSKSLKAKKKVLCRTGTTLFEMKPHIESENSADQITQSSQNNDNLNETTEYNTRSNDYEVDTSKAEGKKHKLLRHNTAIFNGVRNEVDEEKVTETPEPYDVNAYQYEVQYYYDEYGNPYYYDENNVAQWYYSQPFSEHNNGYHGSAPYDENQNECNPEQTNKPDSYAESPRPSSLRDHNNDEEDNLKSGSSIALNDSYIHHESSINNDMDNLDQNNIGESSYEDLKLSGAMLEGSFINSSLDDYGSAVYTYSDTEKNLFQSPANNTSKSINKNEVSFFDPTESPSTTKGPSKVSVLRSMRSDHALLRTFSTKERQLHFSDSDDDEEVKVKVIDKKKIKTQSYSNSKIVTLESSDDEEENVISNSKIEIMSSVDSTPKVIVVEDEGEKKYKVNLRKRTNNIMKHFDSDSD